MSGSIKEYLERQPTECLKAILSTFSREDMIDKYGYAIKYIKEELEKRED